MLIVLYDNEFRHHLYPLTLTGSVGLLRCGIMNAKERWGKIFDCDVMMHVPDYLKILYPAIPFEEQIWIDAAVLPDEPLTNAIQSLKDGSALYQNHHLIAAKTTISANEFSASIILKNLKAIDYTKPVDRIIYPWDLFRMNFKLLEFDFSLLSKERSSESINQNNIIIGENFFAEQGADINCSTFNTQTGPIYIGKNAVIMEGCNIRGPFAVNDNSVVKMGATIYGATTLGKNCVAGGEIKNSILNDYTNKAHEGYLGDSVLGEWCNLGAGTNVSNVKNTGAPFRFLKNEEQEYPDKCGVIMGSYSRTTINTAINSGSVIGVCSHIFSPGFLQQSTADFSWGLNAKYDLQKAFQHIENWKGFKEKTLAEPEKKVLEYLHNNTK